MTAHDYDLVCIGSGPAGQRAAIQSAKLGMRVAVIEKMHAVGGGCIDTGTIPSKTFREAVRRAYSRPGLATRQPVERVRPTMEQLVGHVSHVIQREIDIVQDALTRNGIELIRGRAAFECPHTIAVETSDGRRRVSAANVLIAVGTVPSKPRGIEPDGEVIMTSDTILEMKRLPKTMVVVGAGVIGVEYASMFAALGVQVTVIDQRERALEFLDREIVDELIHQLRVRDVLFRFGERVAGIDVTGTPKQALLSLASGKHVVSDVVLFSAGRLGATTGLDLGAAGLSADERGRLAVDGSYRTAANNIWAAGDVIGFPALAATSAEQGRIAACAMFGHPATPMGNNFPVGIYAIPEISMVGKTEEELTAEMVPYEAGIARYREISRGPILGDDSGMFKMLFDRRNGQLLGCHCIGSGATELIHVGQAVLGLGGGLDYFLSTIFNYPTLAECYKVAAHNAANRIALIERATRP